MSDNRPANKPQQPSATVREVSTPAKASAKSWYVVLHGAVGQWVQGTVISSDDLDGIDIDRLLGLGAIQPTQEPIKDVAPTDDDGH